LLCVDEVCPLGNASSPITEAIVAQMRAISGRPEMAALPIAILCAIALSVTAIPNPHTPCDRPGAEQTVIRSFDASFRPTPLSVTMIGFGDLPIPAESEAQTLLPKLPATIHEHARGRPTVVFFASDASMIQGADLIARERYGAVTRLQRERF
jgi:hypothetical protein